MYFNQDEESIYNIVQREAPPPEKPARHRSKHDPKMPPSASTFKIENTSKPGVQNLSGIDPLGDGGKQKYEKQHATLGTVPGSNRLDPALWKERMEDRKTVNSTSDVNKAQPDKLVPTELKPQQKPCVPGTSSDVTSVPYKPLPPTQKNFIVANAVEAILAAPKKVKEEPNLSKDRPGYGKVPAYLQKIKTDIVEEYEYIERMQAEEEANRANKIQEMTKEGQEELIEGLKARWEKVNHAYQSQTHLTKLDTLGKIRRKETNEKELSQLEKDIEKISKAHLFVDTTYYN